MRQTDYLNMPPLLRPPHAIVLLAHLLPFTLGLRAAAPTPPDDDPPREPVLREELRVGEFHARRYDVGWSSRIELVPLDDPARPSFVLIGYRLRIGREQDDRRFGIGDDHNADDIPDLLISEWSGGAHCCSTDFIISLDSHPRILDTIRGRHSEPHWQDLDGDGRPEVRVHDWIFDYWATSFAGSPAPSVILTWRSGRYRPAEHLMTKPRPSDSDIVAQAARLRAADGIEDRDGIGLVMAEVLDLLYSGNRDQGWRLLELAWLPAFGPDRDTFISRFKEQLERSPYWPEIQHFQPAAGEDPLSP